MRTPSDRPLRSRRAVVSLLAAAFAVLALVAWPGIASASREWDSPENNVILSIPDGPASWDWLDYRPEWGKAGIVKGAERVLTTIRGTDKPANGQGALLHLAVLEAKEGMTLEQAVQDPKFRQFFLGRFEGSEGPVESEEFTVDSASNPDGHPAIVLRTSGTAFNLKTKKAPCRGHMVVTVARGKVFLLRMYAFPVDDYDADGLKGDLDFLEANCLRLVNSKEDAPKAMPPKDGEKGGDGDGNGGDGPPENEKDEIIENVAQKWRLVLDKKLVRQEITDEERALHIELKCEGNDSHGGYQFYIYAPPTSDYLNGQKLPPPDLTKWIGPDWWKDFTIACPEGELATFDWPKKPSTKGAKTFLTLPDLDDEEARHVVFKAEEKRPVEVDYAEMRKMGFVEKVKDGDIGPKGKASEAVRGCMQGRRPKIPGYWTVFRFAFRSPSHSYRVFVTFWGEGHKKWGDALRRTLESWEFGVKFKR